MSGIVGASSGGVSGYDKSSVQPKKPSVIKIPDLDNSLDNTKVAEEFKKEVSTQLNVPQDEIKIITNKAGVSAKVGASTIPVEFQDKADLSRVAKMSVNSSALSINFLGDEKNDKVITIPNYPNGFTKEQDIDRFKNDIARELKTDQKNIEVFKADDQIVAKKKDSDERFIVKFNDPKDSQRFLDYASNSPSRRLADFGIKQHEGEFRTGFSTNLADPKHGSNITTGITYGTFIGDHQRIVVDANLSQNPSQPIGMHSLQNFSLTYQNLDVPFLGDYGAVTLKYDNGKVKVDGKSAAIDVMANNWGKNYIDGIKHGDGKAIAQTVGVAAAVAGGLYLAKEYLPERHELDLPIKARVYGNGENKINAIVAPTIGVGGKQLDFSLHKAGIEAEQNIASGQNFRERVIYDFKNKGIEAEVQGNYAIGSDNIYGRADIKYSKENKIDNRASVALGYSQMVSDKTSVNYYFAEEFNNDFKPKSTSANVGVSYRPDRDWTINANVGLSRPEGSDSTGVTLGLGISKRF